MTVLDPFTPSHDEQGGDDVLPELRDELYVQLGDCGLYPTRSGKEISSLCSAHDDHTASMSSTVKLGKDGGPQLFMHCMAGCSFEEIGRTSRITMRTLLYGLNGHVNGATPIKRIEPEKGTLLEPLPTEGELQQWERELAGSEIAKRLIDRRGWSPLTMALFGLGLNHERRITFPFRDAGGNLLSVERYAPDTNDGPKTLVYRGHSRHLLLPPGGIDGASEFFICEGPSDTIAAHSRGLTAVGAPSATIWKPEYTEILRTSGVKRANIVFDCDDAGRKGRDNVAQKLSAGGIATCVVDLDPARDDGRDLTDFLLDNRDKSAAQLTAWLKRLARPYGADPHLQRDDDDWPELGSRGLPAFPDDAVPSAVANFVTALAEQTQVPVDLAAMLSLGVLSAAAVGGAFVDCGQWTEELALFLLIAAASGERKTATLEMAKKPLSTIEAERVETARPHLAALKAKRKALESREAKLAKRLGGDDATDRSKAEDEYAIVQAELDELPEPHVPRIFANDATPEALATLLARHGSIAVLTDESSPISNMLGHYSDGRPNLHLVLSAYTGAEYTIDRKGREPERLPRPTMAFVCAVQPHVLEAVVTHQIAREQGFVARFAYVLAPSRVGDREVDTASVPPQVIQAWIAAVRRVASLKSADSADSDAAKFRRDGSIVGIVSGFQPRRITLAPEAKRLVTELQRQIEPRMGPQGDLHSIADWATRNHGRVVRIAALLHLCEHGPEEPIGEQTMRDAVRIGEYLLAHARAALSIPNEPTRKAISWLERRGEPVVTLRDIQRGPLRSAGKAADAHELAERLIALGVLRSLEKQHPTSRRYAVHPDLVRGESLDADTPSGRNRGADLTLTNKPQTE